MKRKAQKALAGIAAAIAAVYGTNLLWGVGHMAWSLAGSGSGGIGAASLGLSEALLPLAVGAVTNRVLAGWARRAGGVVLAFHRAHTATLLLLAVLVVLSVLVLAGLRVGFEVFLWLATGLIGGFALAAQSLLLAVILAFFATQKPASAP